MEVSVFLILSINFGFDRNPYVLRTNKDFIFLLRGRQGSRAHNVPQTATSDSEKPAKYDYGKRGD